eukprot:Amastigsp_a682513_22.p4 type:complete len:101 gc:universal Amastigsp_a682513_22:815-513(-)
MRRLHEFERKLRSRRRSTDASAVSSIRDTTAADESGAAARSAQTSRRSFHVLWIAIPSSTNEITRRTKENMFLSHRRWASRVSGSDNSDTSQSTRAWSQT